MLRLFGVAFPNQSIVSAFTRVIVKRIFCVFVASHHLFLFCKHLRVIVKRFLGRFARQNLSPSNFCVLQWNTILADFAEPPCINPLSISEAWLKHTNAGLFTSPVNMFLMIFRERLAIFCLLISSNGFICRYTWSLFSCNDFWCTGTRRNNQHYCFKQS